MSRLVFCYREFNSIMQLLMRNVQRSECHNCGIGAATRRRQARSELVCCRRVAIVVFDVVCVDTVDDIDVYGAWQRCARAVVAAALRTRRIARRLINIDNIDNIDIDVGWQRCACDASRSCVRRARARAVARQTPLRIPASLLRPYTTIDRLIDSCVVVLFRDSVRVCFVSIIRRNGVASNDHDSR
jgi:hypothetical protein